MLYRYRSNFTDSKKATDSQKAVAKQFQGRLLEILNDNGAVANVIDRADGKVFSQVPLWSLEVAEGPDRTNRKRSNPNPF